MKRLALTATLFVLAFTCLMVTAIVMISTAHATEMPDLDLAKQCLAATPGWIGWFLAPLIIPHIDAWFKQPAAGSMWLLIRKPFSLLMGNYGFAKNANQQTLTEWWTSNRQALASFLVKTAGDALKAELDKTSVVETTKITPVEEGDTSHG